MTPTVRLASGLSALFLAVASPCAGWAEGLQKPEPGRKIKVFLLAGQSNMEGRADGTKLTTQDMARLKKAQGQVQLAYNYEPVRPLNVIKPDPEIEKAYHLELLFGPELFFGMALSEAWPDEKILLIKRTQGGTSLYGCWNPDWSAEKAALMKEEQEPKLYSALTSYVQQVLSGYTKNEYEICAMLWVQGENDAGNETAAAAYGANLQNLVNRIRRDVGRPALPFLLFQVGQGGVVEGMKQTAQKLPDVTLMPQSLDPTSKDFYTKIPNGHYDVDGMRKLGQRFAEAFLGQSQPSK